MKMYGKGHLTVPFLLVICGITALTVMFPHHSRSLLIRCADDPFIPDYNGFGGAACMCPSQGMRTVFALRGQ
ncbi:MAG: hypothetical protein B6245_03745 [Desulfobacteraceae bacterium 4572_88]|nr:MAG: hypothetical protein B6245_03745 [Desulfobacteraceae bacterium 4572_88]